MKPESDYEFVDRIFSRGLASRAGQPGLDSLSVPERNVVFVWWAKGIIDNGGFEELLSTETDIREIEQAARDIGLDGFAWACRNVRDAFPSEGPSKDPSVRQAQMEALLEREDRLESENNAVWKMDAEFDRLVARYVRANQESFAVSG